MSAFRRFDPWAGIGAEPDRPAKVAKAAKAPPRDDGRAAGGAEAAPRRDDPFDVNTAGPVQPEPNFSHFSRFSRSEPANREAARRPAEVAPPAGERPSTEAAGTVAREAADWRAFLAERAATAEAASRVDRATAERWAYEACVVRWLNANPPPDDPTRCAHSGEPLPADGGDAVPVLRGGGGHAWVRRRHLAAWRARRRAAAVAALAALGVRAP